MRAGHSRAAARADARYPGWRTDFAHHSVALNQFQDGGPPRDGIPPIDHPRVVTQPQGDRFLDDREPVMVIEQGAAARAYPIQILVWHELSSTLPGGNHPDALIFTTPSGLPVRHGLFYKRVFTPARAKALPADKQAFRWHDLRHTCASLSLAVAPNLHVVKERLGHEDIRTTVNTYGHMVPSVDAALADGLGALFAAAAEPPAENVGGSPVAASTAD